VHPKTASPIDPALVDPPSSAKQELLAWAAARRLRDRAAGYQARARTASDRNAEERFAEIAGHYHGLAALEARRADRLGSDRRSSSVTTVEARKEDIENLRTQLQVFGRRHDNMIVRLQCQAISRTLLELTETNLSDIRRLLAGHVEQLESALRCAKDPQ
jgi:hypothetical protein